MNYNHHILVIKSITEMDIEISLYIFLVKNSNR